MTATDLTSPAKTATTTLTDKVPKKVYVKEETGGAVTYSPIGSGTGTVAEKTLSQFTVLSGVHVSFTAIPKSGYIFAYWSGEG